MDTLQCVWWGLPKSFQLLGGIKILLHYRGRVQDFFKFLANILHPTLVDTLWPL